MSRHAVVSAVPGRRHPSRCPAMCVGRLLSGVVREGACHPFRAVVVVLGLVLFGCAGGGQDRGEEVTMRACRVCHGADRLCAGLGRLDEKGWDEVVGRMVTHGASLTAEERNLAVGWLVSRKPGDKPPCP
ncbi:hypothetical protein [Nitratidesulfovibrio vulgaris]|uniref:hypothetical protein n=1 Tax=Nitratidesulfovibrio vulgaris TaxID=881 RepID=UPI0013DF54F9|nr:hypothetical protein [Nitratidesulfovibrio vulgaris]